MKSPDAKANPNSDAAQTEPPRTTERHQILQEYVDDLRKIIEKLRERLK